MKIICDTKDFHIEEGTAVTIGKFDGIHMGHKKLIEACVNRKSQGLKALVFTFSPSPESFFGKESKCLTTVDEKRRMFNEIGVDILVEYPFDRETADTEPADFVNNILIGKLNAKFIAAGDDLSFGKGGKGDAAFLKDMSRNLDLDVEVMDKVRVGDYVVSSTLVRETVEAGNIVMANSLLGSPYTVSGEIVHGNRIGRTIGMPTINQIPDEEKLLPPFGVYFSETEIEGREYKGITNIGIKPTVSNDNVVTVETFLYNFNQDVYGTRANVRLFDFLRPEMKFANINELKTQMRKDIEAGYRR